MKFTATYTEKNTTIEFEAGSVTEAKKKAVKLAQHNTTAWTCNIDLKDETGKIYKKREFYSKQRVWQ